MVGHHVFRTKGSKMTPSAATRVEWGMWTVPRAGSESGPVVCPGWTAGNDGI